MAKTIIVNLEDGDTALVRGVPPNLTSRRGDDPRGERRIDNERGPIQPLPVDEVTCEPGDPEPDPDPDPLPGEVVQLLRNGRFWDPQTNFGQDFSYWEQEKGYFYNPPLVGLHGPLMHDSTKTGWLQADQDHGGGYDDAWLEVPGWDMAWTYSKPNQPVFDHLELDYMVQHHMRKDSNGQYLGGVRHAVWGLTDQGIWFPLYEHTEIEGPPTDKETQPERFSHTIELEGKVYAQYYYEIYVELVGSNPAYMVGDIHLKGYK